MKRKLLFLILPLLFAGQLMAQEGMWLLSQIDDLDLESKGLKITTEEIYTPGQPCLADAIIQLGGGTASFVSPNGLILTNHHVAFGALQRASEVQSNYLEEGFLAGKPSDEISAAGYRALLMTEMKDVTEEIEKAAKKITDPEARDRAINEKIVEMTEKIENGKDDVVAIVSELFYGGKYILYTYKQFKDIRIVYAPPLAIGNYGGEIDNWMWPRHTGDFSFMRVYVAPDGTGAEYSKDNVPYQPRVWLKMASGDLDPGDMTFIIGYPGFTTRYRTSNSAAWNLKYNYPFSIQNFGEIIELMDEITKNDPEGKLKVANLNKSLANVLKNHQGKVDGMNKVNFVQKKLDFEKEFTVWVNADPERKKKYGHILDGIKEQYKLLAKTRERDDVFGIFQGLAGTQLNVAAQIYLTSKELEKPESERRPGFTLETVMQNAEQLQYTYMGYYKPVDKALLTRALKRADELPEGQRIEQLAYILDDPSINIDKFVEDAYANSRLDDLEYVKTLFGKSTAELEAMNDPFIALTIKLDPLNDEISDVAQQFNLGVTDLRKQYVQALYEWKGSGLYPDADGTIRFTSGVVKGYRPRDAVNYDPFTTLSGLVEKNTGKEPFNAPENLVKLEAAKDFGKWADPDLKDVPIAFTHLGDITGGNSGSPVMNGKGELIGLAFDGNYEAMIGDWQYDVDIQRVISVDARYVMFITEKFGNAGYLLKEMGINP